MSDQPTTDQPATATATDATVTSIKRTRKSRATRAADQTAPEATAPEVTAPEVTAPAAPKVPGKNEQQREVAEFIIKVTADALAEWNPESHQGVTAEFATAAAARYLAYFPNCQWDSRLGERSLAGRRDRKSA